MEDGDNLLMILQGILPYYCGKSQIFSQMFAKVIRIQGRGFEISFSMLHAVAEPLQLHASKTSAQSKYRIAFKKFNRKQICRKTFESLPKLEKFFTFLIIINYEHN